MNTVSVHTGQSTFELIQQPDLRHYNIQKMDDNAPLIIEKPVRVHYVDPQHGFDLAPTKFVFITQQAGIVTDISTSPTLTYVDLKSGHEDTLAIMNALRNAGWMQTKSYPIDYASVRKSFQSHPAEKIRRPYGSWRLGETVAEVYLQRQSGDMAHLDQADVEQTYLPNINIFDSQLSDKVGTALYKHRQQVSGSAYKPVPLSYWQARSPLP